MKLTIEDLATKVNEQLFDLSSSDKRFSNNVSVRRIRDYISKGVLDKPFKDGKNIYFTELHYQKLIALREVQSEGISEESIKKMMVYESKGSEISLKNEALATINEIINFSNAESAKDLNYEKSILNNSQSRSVNCLNSLIDSSTLSKSKETKSYISKAVSKSWSEIPLTANNKVFFRMESSTTFSEEEKKEVLLNIKQILGITGEKND